MVLAIAVRENLLPELRNLEEKDHNRNGDEDGRPGN